VTAPTSTSGLPTELQRLLDEIDRCERDADSLVADLDDATVNWRPPPGGAWSVAQCLHHLAVINEFYLRDCRSYVKAGRHAGWSFAGLHPTMWGRSFVWWLEPPAKMKTKAASVAQPAPSIPRDQLLPLYKASHAEYRALVHDCADVDVNRVIMPNPFLKSIRMRMATILLVVPAHDRRHLWQAKQVKELLRGRVGG
jgi:DinB family protein